MIGREEIIHLAKEPSITISEFSIEDFSKALTINLNKSKNRKYKISYESCFLYFFMTIAIATAIKI